MERRDLHWHNASTIIKVNFWTNFGNFWLFFGILGFLVTLPMHFPVILTQFVAMRYKRATLKTHFWSLFGNSLALFGPIWPFFWFIRFSGNSANAFSSDLNSICRNEVQTSRFEDAKRGR